MLAVSTEYATGMIRTTLTAAPRRGLTYAAKTLTLAVFALVVSEVFVFSAFLLGQLVLHRQHLNVPVTDLHALRAVTFGGLHMAVVTLVGFGLGALLRSTAAAMTSMVALVFLAYPAARVFEGSSYLPDHLVLINAASALATLSPPTGPHANRIPSLGFALFDLGLYLVVFLGLGAWRALRDT